MFPDPKAKGRALGDRYAIEQGVGSTEMSRVDASRRGAPPYDIFNQMVVYPVEQESADLLFHALADATRRDILRTTLADRHSVTSLSRRYPMSFAAVSKHVAVLERAGLVMRKRQGREHFVMGNPAALQDARLALDQLELLWRDRIDRMGELLAAEPDGKV
jgi:DNA-binding transcriptional ArsR family regulator